MTELLIELVCMVYHEARNVRWPMKIKRIPDAEVPVFRTLISLPPNRDQAWRQMKSDRSKAATIQPIPSGAFEKKYGTSVAQLTELFDRPIWKHSECGGNKWAAISRKVEECLEANATDDMSRLDQLIQEILEMEHNTGKVRDKLEKLNNALGL